MSHPEPAPVSRRSPVTLALTAGFLMAAYLLLRPYGDAGGGDTLDAAEAFASNLWIVSHLAGAAALVALAALWAVLSTGPLRWAGPVGAALVLPYYGAEAFSLHEIGARALAGDPEVLDLVASVRDNPAATALFAVGLIVLAVAGIVAALSWRRLHRPGLAAGAFLPLAVVAALFLPQFFLPPAGRVAYGLAFAVAAVLAAIAARRVSAAPETLTGRRSPAEAAS